MDLNHQKELFSVSLTTAVCAQAGCSWANIIYDDGVDIELIGNQWPLKPKIDVQLKCTSKFSCFSECGSFIKYDLKAKNYNDLVKKYRTPNMLILAIVPEDPKLWLTTSLKNVTLQYGLYYHIIEGQDSTVNSSSKSVTFPIEQRLDKASLTMLMKKLNDTGEFK